MKKLILLLCLFFCLKANAQDYSKLLDSNTHKLTYQEVLHVDTISKDQLYTRAREWFAKSFKSSQDVIQMDDRVAGKIIGKGSGEGTTKFKMLTIDYWIRYTVSITVKEGRYRYEITDFTIETKPSQYMPTTMAQPIESVMNLAAYKNVATAKNYQGMEKMAQDYVSTATNIGTNLSGSIKDALSRFSEPKKSKDDF